MQCYSNDLITGHRKQAKVAASVVSDSATQPMMMMVFASCTCHWMSNDMTCK